MPSSSAIYEIFEGTPAITQDEITYLGLGSDGDPGGLHILTHPDSALAPIVYFKNPDRVVNMDNDFLASPFIGTHVTIGSTQVVRQERDVDDVIVTERWLGSDNRLSMPTAFLRSLIEYWINPPALSGGNPTYITWQPRSRNALTYQVELLSLRAGGSDGEFDAGDLRPGGGSEIQGPQDGLYNIPTGFVDREVELRMKLVAKV